MSWTRKVNWHPLTPLCLFLLVFWKASISFKDYNYPWHTFLFLSVLSVWFLLTLVNLFTKQGITKRLYNNH